ncbi:MAG: bifunctional phosphoribosylaminoimidazolecarboxamide formyltransferase/IMP cyclohydrolase [Ruminococcaceae bacterium]|nr:bifunctional phosphoribosylaminoimidazolecarboxamide formyltransferase/IMP cyclohydrolase [Oscillospiraceae bacterium]
MSKRRALISVSDKTGCIEFAKALCELGYEVLSTGGTAKAIAAAGIEVTEVSSITGFPECLDGRVKTLHPMIHAGILAMRSNPEHMQQIEELGVTPIDIVAINLYPFKATILREPAVSLEEAIENIDIGGPTMIRAAAKNWQDVAVVVDPADYDTVISQLRENGSVDRDTKFRLAGKVFTHTAQYDTLISTYLCRQRGDSILGDTFTMTFEKVQGLRYGENPHQDAAFYREVTNSRNSLCAAEQLWGKELSYNNINDTNGALDVLKEFGTERPCAVAVKHAVPCGVGVAEDLFTAYMKAYESDPVSIFGGIVALNREVDAATAEKLAEIFLEIVIAPSFSQEAMDILTQKKNLRLLRLPDAAQPNTPDMLDMKKVAGGLLVQQLDTEIYDEAELKCVTERQPTEAEMEQLKMAMRVVKHVRSNGICLVRDNGTVGVGPGQTNRVTALKLAIEYAGEKAKGSVMGSDAFFPFADCVEAAAAAGITAIIQPGGSIRDQESIDACNKAGIAMVFTGMRHFKH